MNHRPPEGIPVHLLEPADRTACAEYGADQWAKACAAAAVEAIHSPDARYLREYGLSAAALRKGRALGEHHLNDPLGATVLAELAKQLRKE